jgi:hypothetical protein
MMDAKQGFYHPSEYREKNNLQLTKVMLGRELKKGKKFSENPAYLLCHPFHVKYFRETFHSNFYHPERSKFRDLKLLIFLLKNCKKDTYTSNEGCLKDVLKYLLELNFDSTSIYITRPSKPP